MCGIVMLAFLETFISLDVLIELECKQNRYLIKSLSLKSYITKQLNNFHIVSLNIFRKNYEVGKNINFNITLIIPL